MEAWALSFTLLMGSLSRINRKRQAQYVALKALPAPGGEGGAQRQEGWEREAWLMLDNIATPTPSVSLTADSGIRAHRFAAGPLAQECSPAGGRGALVPPCRI